jgi:phage gp36-like protein
LVLTCSSCWLCWWCSEDEGVLSAHQSALEEAAAELDQAEGVRYWTDFIKVSVTCCWAAAYTVDK